MELLGIGIAAISLIYGAGSYYSQTRRLNALLELKKGLAEIEKAAGAAAARREDKELLRWLGYAALLVPAVRSRLQARLARSFAVILGAFAVAQATEALVPGDQTWEFVLGLVVAIVQAIAAGVNGTLRFLEPVEVEFLAKAEALERQFYASFVEPAMIAFNAKVASHPALQSALTRSANDDDKLRALVREEVARQKSLD